jgi:hypothetical protein
MPGLSNGQRRAECRRLEFICVWTNGMVAVDGGRCPFFCCHRMDHSEHSTATGSPVRERECLPVGPRSVSFRRTRSRLRFHGLPVDREVCPRPAEDEGIHTDQTSPGLHIESELRIAVHLPSSLRDSAAIACCRWEAGPWDGNGCSSRNESVPPSSPCASSLLQRVRF